ncbi:hypothetical protein LTR35_014475 [Friedmanniomyces endolithicus]|uniref:Uncharacterized protein n=1 Tax=Friedmanniomyces endolithicus TaxID=329885 RepID=A0AAN6FD61_9PEZI|nr:hypothetical protein LTR35_014475 [Friedmanniomyces endolithicus]KAK0270159.1 hypothetical protein LTS00_017048 [Friedmanniomyces endolithicus]KAK0312462.1 hypothetical protein LTR82_013932 [Friedmanniomyces endolithicus]KAK0988761.1 hypothetical protein LTR54_012721 [Friedmanniomyces endolithicus]
MSLPSIVSQYIDAMIADEFSAEGTLTLDHQYHCRPVTDLETAVADASLSTVFIILAEWQVTKQMLDHTSKIRPLFTATALVMALQCNRSDILSLLISTNSAIRMPVKEAILAGYVANFQAFLYNGWDINEQLDLDGPPALGYAVKYRHLVSWFLANGADPNAEFEYDTALSRAALAGSPETVEILLSHGGDVKRGQVLHWAVSRHENTWEVLKLFLKRGASPNQIEFDGVLPIWTYLQVLGTPLHKAVTLRKRDVVALLLEYGADPEKQDTSGKTARMMAEELGLDSIVSLMQCETLCLPRL